MHEQMLLARLEKLRKLQKIQSDCPSSDKSNNEKGHTDEKEEAKRLVSAAVNHTFRIKRSYSSPTFWNADSDIDACYIAQRTTATLASTARGKEGC